jgi:hypothetical protein
MQKEAFAQKASTGSVRWGCGNTTLQRTSQWAFAAARARGLRFIPPRQPGDASGTWQAYCAKWPHVPAALWIRRSSTSFPSLSASPRRARYRQAGLLVTGSENNVSVLSSVLAGVDLGYLVVKDSLCSSSDKSHNALIGLYAKRFEVQIELAEAGEILENWRIYSFRLPCSRGTPRPRGLSGLWPIGERPPIDFQSAEPRA